MIDNNRQTNRDFSDFLKFKSDAMPPMPPPHEVTRDLVGSRWRLALIYTLGSLAGYLATLVICAQCSIGLAPLAWQTASLMERWGATGCAIFCGSIFGIGPFVATSVFLTRFQHRFLLFRMTWLPIIIPAIACLLMTMIGTPHPWSWHGFWILSAVLTPYILESIAAFTLKQQRWSGSNGKVM